MAENSVSNPKSKTAPVWVGSVVWFDLTKRVGGRVRFLRSRIINSLARAKMVWVVSVLPETMRILSSNMYAGKPKIPCYRLKDVVPGVQLMILSLVWYVRKYLFRIRTYGVPIVNLWYSILPELYANIPLVSILGLYERFTSKNFLSWCLWTFLRHIPSLLDSYQHFTLNPFIFW